MSIDDEQLEIETVTDGDRALDLFVDRVGFTRLLAEQLNDPVTGQILYFYGDGGNGKSLLLKYLRQRICKRFLPRVWQSRKVQPDAELAQFIETAPVNTYVRVPVVLHDFGLTSPFERPQDPFYGLLLLRKNLAEAAAKLHYRLRFPLYDFACIWYLRQKGKSLEEIRSLFPLSDVAGGFATLLDAVTGNAVGAIATAALNFVVEDLEEKVTGYLSQIKSPAEKIREIQQQDVDTELIFSLPKLLAQDLNAAMAQDKAPSRIVLFFDTHEAFWGQQKHESDTLFFAKDEWLRCLLRGLELKAGIVVVVAGREVPRWAEAIKPKTDIPAKYLWVLQVGHLAVADARVYLQRVGIEAATLSEKLIADASVAVDEVHPLYLGLGADTVLQAERQGITLSAADLVSLPGANPAKVLIERLLKYVDRDIRYAVHALSACRAFNFELFKLLGQELDFQPTRPNFDLLREFSFVWRAKQRGENWYRIHDLLRRLDNRDGNEITQQAHQVLEQHYQAQNSAESIYHANRLDWQRGVDEWVEVFEEALRLSRYEQCRNLLEICPDLLIQDDFQMGVVSYFEGEHFAQLARHAEAQQEYREAIESYDQHLFQAPDDIAAHNNKGAVLQSLAGLQAKLSRYNEAQQNYQQAIESFNQATALSPDDIAAHNNKGNALQSLAILQANLSQHNESQQNYLLAIESYNQALSGARDYIDALNNIGIALQNLAILQAKLSQHNEARQNYQLAIESFDQAISRANDVQLHNNKGNTLESLAILQAKLSQHNEAQQSYQLAIESFDQAISCAPDYIAAHNNKGNALRGLAYLQIKLLQYNEAQRNFQQAIKSYSQAISRAPDLIGAHNNKGNALQSLADLQVNLSQHNEAQHNYQQAIESYDQALCCAPNFINALNDKGVALKNLGNLQVALGQRQAAKNKWQEALRLFARVLQLAPNDADAQRQKDVVQALSDGLDDEGESVS